MKITLPHKDEGLLREIRSGRVCEFCKKPAWHGLEPHHLWTRGQGGWSRLDIRINLIGLHRWCHQAAEDGNIKRPVLLAIVAEREQLSPGAIQDEIERLLWRQER